MWDEWGNWSDIDVGNVFDGGFDFGGGFGDPSGGDLFPGDVTGGSDYSFDYGPFDPGSNLPAIPAVDGGSGWGGWDLSGILENVQDVFKAALAINAAYKAAGKPPVRASTPETTANANGTLTTKTATGGTVTVKMTPGTPYVTASGVLVTNNGDGTYTTTMPDGSAVIRHYPAGAAQSGGSLAQNPMVWLGAGALALLVLPKLMR